MLIILINLCCSLILTGLIWTVQVVHYPSFRFVSREQFLAFCEFHQSQITYVVLPLMVVELGSSLLLWAKNINSPLALLLAICVIMIWAATFFLSVPLHAQLVQNGYDVSIINKLVVTNWPRTILWTLRSMVLISMVHSYVKN